MLIETLKFDSNTGRYIGVCLVDMNPNMDISEMTKSIKDRISTQELDLNVDYLITGKTEDGTKIAGIYNPHLVKYSLV